MILKRILFLLAGISLILTACNEASLAPLEATAGPTARPSRTPTLLPTPPFTSTPAPLVVNIGANVECRTGPGPYFDLVTLIEVDAQTDSGDHQYPLLGTAGGYWQIMGPTGQECWIPAQYELPLVVAGTVQPVAPPATPTLLTPTAAPPAVEGLVVKKKKCALSTSEKPYTHYVVDIIFVLEWADVPGEDGYRIYRDGNLVGELPANATVFSETFELKKPGRASTFYIVTFNVLGETRSAQFSFSNPC